MIDKQVVGSARSWTAETAAGIALIVALMFVMVIHHPVASNTGPGGMMANMARQASMDRWVHGTLAAAMTAMTSLMIGFAARLGLDRPHILLGMVAYGLALVLICLSVVLDGFIAPAVAERCMTIGGECASETQLLRYGALQIEFMSRVGLIAIAVSTAMWAADLAVRGDRALLAGIMGLASAAVQFGMLLLNGEHLRPHSLALIVAAQAVWYLAVALVIGLRWGPYGTVPSG